MVSSTDTILGDNADLPAVQGSIQVPTQGLVDWLWLQPYKNPPVGDTWETDYNVLSLQDVNGSPQGGAGAVSGHRGVFVDAEAFFRGWGSRWLKGRMML